MSDDPALQRCRVSDGNSCSGDADCFPASSCDAEFSETAYARSVCRASGTGPAPDTLGGRCGLDDETACDQVVGGGTCLNAGSTTYCAGNAGASCSTSADCLDGSKSSPFQSRYKSEGVLIARASTSRHLQRGNMPAPGDSRASIGAESQAQEYLGCSGRLCQARRRAPTPPRPSRSRRAHAQSRCLHERYRHDARSQIHGQALPLFCYVRCFGPPPH